MTCHIWAKVCLPVAFLYDNAAQWQPILGNSTLLEQKEWKMPVTPAALARSRFKSTALSVCTFLYWCDSVRGGSESIDGILPHELPCLPEGSTSSPGGRADVSSRSTHHAWALSYEVQAHTSNLSRVPFSMRRASPADAPAAFKRMCVCALSSTSPEQRVSIIQVLASDGFALFRSDALKRSSSRCDWQSEYSLSHGSW